MPAGQLQQSRERAAGTATAYFCACAAALLAGCSGVAACAQNLALLGALAAALAPGGVLLSPVLLAVGSADWLPGGVLLAVSVAAGTWAHTPWLELCPGTNHGTLLLGGAQSCELPPVCRRPWPCWQLELPAAAVAAAGRAAAVAPCA